MNVVCSVVIPMYNEEAVIGETYKRLKNVMEGLGQTYELIFINDGSRDRSAHLVYELSHTDSTIRLLDFSRNFGHQAAVMAGLEYASGTCVVIIDADLQDPPEVIPEMIQKWKEGYEVVYGKRLKRKGDTPFKKATAFLFYRFLRAMTNNDIPMDTGDFRLIDRKVCDVMKNLQEKNKYIRGLVSWIGFRQIPVEYNREERWAGKSKYPLKKMLRFAMDAITSFSYKPLKLATYLGFLLSLSGFIYLLVVIYQRLFTHTTISGWTSIVVINLFFNGIVLIILGIIGEYIGRIYEEAKNRPSYIIREKIGFSSDNEGPYTHPCHKE